MRNAPLFFRTFIIDSTESALGLVFALSLVLPGSVEQAKVQAVVIVSAVLAAVISSARRAVPGFMTWFKEQLGLTAA